MKKPEKTAATKNKEEPQKEEEEEFEDIVEYKLNFDFSKLVKTLKQTRKDIKMGDAEISALRVSMLGVKEDKDLIQEKLVGYSELQQKTAVSLI